MIDHFIREITKELPIKGYPKDVKEKLIEIVNQFVYLRRSIRNFRFGQTTDLGRRKYNQFDGREADEMIPLYSTNNQDYASEVESFLLQEYGEHIKNFNFKLDSRGKTSTKKPHIVYISIKKRFLRQIFDFLKEEWLYRKRDD